MINIKKSDLLNEYIKIKENEILKQETINELIDQAMHQIKELEDSVLQHHMACEMLKISIHEASRYLTVKQGSMIEAINKTIESISNLMQTPTEFILQLKEESVDIVTQKDIPISLAEGGGYRAIAATQIKTLALWNSNFSKLLILDEPIAQANRKNSLFLAEFLKEMGKTMQIFFVAQDAINYMVDVSDATYLTTYNADTKLSTLERVK